MSCPCKSRGPSGPEEGNATPPPPESCAHAEEWADKLDVEQRAHEQTRQLLTRTAREIECLRRAAQAVLAVTDTPTTSEQEDERQREMTVALADLRSVVGSLGSAAALLPQDSLDAEADTVLSLLEQAAGSVVSYSVLHATLGTRAHHLPAIISRLRARLDGHQRHSRTGPIQCVSEVGYRLEVSRG